MENFRIYIDRLKHGLSEEIKEELSPSFLEIKEEHLKFEDNVSMSGKAYLAEDQLVIQLSVKTMVHIPCKICNQWIHHPIQVVDLYHVEPIKQIKSGVFDFTEVVREALLLEVPHFLECNLSCRNRGELSTYLKKESSSSRHAYSPFEGLSN